MNLFTLEKWPLLVICVAMIASAVIDWWKFKVPNWLTLPTILTGWLLGVVYDIGVAMDWLTYPEGLRGSRILASLACTAEGFFLLLLMYMFRMVGGGDVKMTMGFGAWVGAFLGPSQGPWVVLMAWVVGALAGGVIGLAMMLIGGREQFKEHMQVMRETLASFVEPGSIAKKAEQRKSRLKLLPYGVPLCIGFVGYLLYFYSA